MTEDQACYYLSAADSFVNAGEAPTIADLAALAKTVHYLRAENTTALDALAKRQIRTVAQAESVARLLMSLHPEPPCDPTSKLYWRLAKFFGCTTA